ncbi:MAG: helix-hairpin-helix domain-containing protein [Acidimicrobiia bacterium]
MKRATRIGGVVAGVAAAGVAMVWLLKDRILGPETTPVTREQAPRFRVVPSLKPGRRSSHSADDLSEIKGIGPVYKARLIDGGVTTFSALATTAPARLAEIAEVGEETAAAWAKQASTLAG